MRCQTDRTKGLTTWTRRRAALHWRASEAEGFAGEGVTGAGRASVAHDDISVPLTWVAVADFAIPIAVEFAFAGEGNFAVSLTR